MAEAEKNLLRTHTTAVSSRMLYKLAQEGFKPAKYFSIDRVFRNEAVDRTHLAEFHQIEGSYENPCCVTAKVLGYGLTHVFSRSKGCKRFLLLCESFANAHGLIATSLWLCLHMDNICDSQTNAAALTKCAQVALPLQEVCA